LALIHQTPEMVQRKHSRVDSRVALTVEWEEQGKTLQTTGYTVDVSSGGCMAIIGQDFPWDRRCDW
jgi:hypothetical protein